MTRDLSGNPQQAIGGASRDGDGVSSWTVGGRGDRVEESRSYLTEPAQLEAARMIAIPDMRRVA
jgi:hypothetical protein